MTNIQYNRKLLKIAILTDILEAETKAIDPNKTVKDELFKMKLNNMLLSAGKLRKYFDNLFSKLDGSTGDYYDAIDSAIEKTIDELDK